MNARTNFSTLSIAAAALTLATAAALPLALASPAFASDARKKAITVHVHDDTPYPVQIHCSLHDHSIKPGQTISFKLPLGDAITTTNSTPKYPAGTKIVSAYPYLNDATIVLH